MFYDTIRARHLWPKVCLLRGCPSFEQGVVRGRADEVKIGRGGCFVGVAAVDCLSKVSSEVVRVSETLVFSVISVCFSDSWGKGTSEKAP